MTIDPDSTPRDGAARRPDTVVISGMSGAGRSTAINAFEDQGFFCIDNLPPAMILQVIKLAELPGSNIERVAVVCDVRGKVFFDELVGVLDGLDETGYSINLLFLEADDRALVQRFKETRRPHPLALEGGLSEGIRMEREMLRELRGRADLIIDTSDMQPKQLKETIRTEMLHARRKDVLTVAVSSFGFKYGLPLDADIVMDVRFLPNPFYDPRLRMLTGQDEMVRSWVLSRPQAEDFMERWTSLLLALAPRYLDEDKAHLSIAIGCTGGMHRSVVLAEETCRAMNDAGYQATITHRDIDKDREHE